MAADTTVESLLRRDRWVVLALLLTVMAASWAYLLAGAGMEMSAWEMTRIAGAAESSGGGAMTPAAWSPGYAVLMFLMWWIMMIAMMLPGATPTILVFAAVNRRRRESKRPYVATTLFTLAYLVAWAGFSLMATGFHAGLHHGGLLAPGMALTGHALGAGILLAAGLYQVTPIKKACVKHCRSPIGFLAAHWKPGTRGALVTGMRHGIYCLGCCWVFMLLLFFGGVMNLYWIAGLAGYVLVEKVIPDGDWLDYSLGLTLAGGGIWLFVQGAASL